MLVPGCLQESRRREPGAPGRPDRGCKGHAGLWVLTRPLGPAIFWGDALQRSRAGAAHAAAELCRCGAGFEPRRCVAAFRAPACSTPRPAPAAAGWAGLRDREQGCPWGLATPAAKRCCWVLPSGGVVCVPGRRRSPCATDSWGGNGEPDACRRAHVLTGAACAPSATVPQFPRHAHPYCWLAPRATAAGSVFGGGAGGCLAPRLRGVCSVYTAMQVSKVPPVPA